MKLIYFFLLLYSSVVNYSLTFAFMVAMPNSSALSLPVFVLI